MPPTAAPAWKVINQSRVSGPDAQGRYVPGVQITAQLMSGTQFHVFVPDSDYRADRVKALLSAKATEVHAVDQLTG